ncbi:MAG: hypothetical protein ACOCM8_11560, partial [Acetivibrio ethanolgignens]
MKLRPFDSSVNGDFSMYDKLPYKKDIDLCGPDKIAMESGNVIKFFRYTLKDTYQLTGMDDLFYEKLEKHQKEQETAQSTEKNALERLADTLIPEEDIETVENPQTIAPVEGSDTAAAEVLVEETTDDTDSSAIPKEFWEDDWS